MLLCDRLTFLGKCNNLPFNHDQKTNQLHVVGFLLSGKYREFHLMYENGEFLDAAHLLISLLTSNLAPKR
jgi:hypothetical protein